MNLLITRYLKFLWTAQMFTNVRLTLRPFSVWPLAQPVVEEMEMQCCQLSNITARFSDFSDSFSAFFSQKSN